MLFDVCRHLLYLSKFAIRRIYSVTAALFISNMVTVDLKYDIENLIDLSRCSSVSKFYHSIYSKTIISLLSLSFWVFFDSFHIRLFFSQNLFFFQSSELEQQQLLLQFGTLYFSMCSQRKQL